MMRFNSALLINLLVGSSGVLAVSLNNSTVVPSADQVAGLNQPTHTECSVFKEKDACVGASALDFKQLPCTWCPDNNMLANCRYDPVSATCGGERTVAACDMASDFKLIVKDWNLQLQMSNFTFPDPHKELPWCDLCDATFSYRVDAYLKVVELRFGVSARDYDRLRNSLILSFKRFAFARVKDMATEKQQDGVNAMFDDLYFVLDRCNPAMQIWGHHGMLQQAADILFAHFAGAALSVAGAVGVSEVAMMALQASEIAIDASIKAYGGLDIVDIMIHEIVAEGPGYIYWPIGYAGGVIEDVMDLPSEIINSPTADVKPSKDPRTAIM